MITALDACRQAVEWWSGYERRYQNLGIRPNIPKPAFINTARRAIADAESTQSAFVRALADGTLPNPDPFGRGAGLPYSTHHGSLHPAAGLGVTKEARE